jgi:hypothetical protein
VTLGAKPYALLTRGPLIDVDVTHHPLARAAMKQEEALWGGDAPSIRVSFLVDTGARNSVIDQQLVDDLLKIEPIGAYVSIATAGGVVRECPTYRVELQMKLQNGVGILPTTIVGLPTGGLLSRSHFRGILGRSSLQRARFFYDGAAGSFDIELVK